MHFLITLIFQLISADFQLFNSILYRFILTDLKDKLSGVACEHFEPNDKANKLV